MADDNNFLDSYLTSEGKSAPKEQTNQNTNEMNLEDEFTKLLKDFISQDSDESTRIEDNQTDSEQTLDSFEENDNQAEETGGLDSFATVANDESLDSYVEENNTSSEESAGGLDGFVSSEGEQSGGLDGFVSSDGNQSGGLDGFVSNEGGQSSGLEGFISPNSGTASNSGELDGMVTETSGATPENENGLKQEEQELARAISNFQDGVTAMASNKNLKMPKTDYTESMLKPNYKPSVGKKIAQYLLDCWDIINRYDPENMKRLSPNATDEEYLSFAESVSDVYLQLSIISYVEILINIEICEVNYEQQKQLILKNRIKRELYEEYMELQERKSKFIQKLKEKKFPIDADKLINNYFRAAQKDADGAFEALTKNPAMFSRIEIEKLRPKFFGLIKVTPEDGIRMNQKIGKFIKNLKV